MRRRENDPYLPMKNVLCPMVGMGYVWGEMSIVGRRDGVGVLLELQ